MRDRFICQSNAIAEITERPTTNAYVDVVCRLCAAIEAREASKKSFAYTELSNVRLYRRRTNLNGLRNELHAYLHLVPDIDFNSQRYNINVIEEPLMRCLMGDVWFVAKKSDAITCVQAERLCFLDAVNFI